MNHRAQTEIKKISIGRETVAKVDELLYSKLEDKVPYGAWQTYITRLIQEDFRRRQVSEETMELLEDCAAQLREAAEGDLLKLSREFALRLASAYLAKQMNVEDQLIYQQLEDLLGGRG